jgi:hypothetical protein
MVSVNFGALMMKKGSKSTNILGCAVEENQETP